jgi:hypothetical protein
MDVLRADAVRLLQKLPFESTDQYEVIDIKSSPTEYTNAIFEERTVSDVELQAFINDSPSESDCISTKMVRMHYHPDRGIRSHSSVFQSLWQSFRLDPYMIYMFLRNVPGFFQLPSTSPDNPVLRFYVNCQAHWLLWSYDPSTFSTKAILLSRASPGGPSAYPHLHARLKDYAVLAGHPLYPAVATAVERISYVDVFLRQQHIRVGHAERYTGFSHFHINMPRRHVEDSEAELDNLSNLSRSASSVLVGLADMVQHLQCATTVVDVMLNSNLVEGMHGGDWIARRETEIKDIAKILNPQLEQRYGYVNYIKERAQNQVSVVSLSKVCWNNQLIRRTDLQSPGPRRRPSKHRHSKSCYARQYEHEDGSNHDHGLPARDVLCSPLRCAVTAMGQAEHYWGSVLGLLGGYDSDHNFGALCLVRYLTSRADMGKTDW